MTSSPKICWPGRSVGFGVGLLIPQRSSSERWPLGVGAGVAAFGVTTGRPGVGSSIATLLWPPFGSLPLVFPGWPRSASEVAVGAGVATSPREGVVVGNGVASFDAVSPWSLSWILGHDE